MGKVKRIDEMFAFVVTDPADDTEGVIGKLGGSGWQPMVGADMERVDQLRPTAQVVADTGLEVRLLKFSTREVVETLTPRQAE